MSFPVLVSAAEAHQLLQQQPDASILDVRWSLSNPQQREEYAHSHIPGAVYVDMDTQLSRKDAAPSEGRHPLPLLQDFEVAARSWGIKSLHTPVLVYDDVSGQGAARAWWLLTRSGFTRVHVLDGGFTAWLKAGLPAQKGEVIPSVSTVSLVPTPDTLPAAKRNELERAAANQYLIDVRSESRFLGTEEPVDPVAGHIPGAQNLPISRMLQNGKFRDAQELSDMFVSLGVEEHGEVVLYCGSGITAAQAALALTRTNINARIFPPSWSGWIHKEEAV